MKIYTSYFAMVNRLVSANITPISIALYSPKGWNGACYPKLAPTGYILSNWKRNPVPELYVYDYLIMVLGTLDVHTVVKELEELSGGKNIALLCYEKSGDFCHRNIVADWLRRNGYPCSEIAFKPKEVIKNGN